jgi:predicted O-methyltransferase YrrM
MAESETGRAVHRNLVRLLDFQEAHLTDSLDELKIELERFGKANDSANDEYARRMMNITRDTGQFLSVLVRATAARRILEIGTSNGYSTLWLAEAARANAGMVTTVDKSEYKVGLASANFARSGLAPFITSLNEDAGRALERAETSSYDFMFLDTERSAYPGWWPDLRRILRPGGLLVADNATSHAQQLAPFVALVESDPSFVISVVPVGNGEFLAAKASS